MPEFSNLEDEIPYPLPPTTVAKWVVANGSHGNNNLPHSVGYKTAHFSRHLASHASNSIWLNHMSPGSHMVNSVRDKTFFLGICNKHILNDYM
jgi:hypothetical protein